MNIRLLKKKKGEKQNKKARPLQFTPYLAQNSTDFFIHWSLHGKQVLQDS